MQARTLGARTDVSRLLLLESDPSIEQIVRDDLLAAVADKIEDVAIEGGVQTSLPESLKHLELGLSQSAQTVVLQPGHRLSTW